jgi:hypothetical protein
MKDPKGLRHILDTKDPEGLQHILDTWEAVAQRILDAVAKVDSKLVGNLDGSFIDIVTVCYLAWPVLRKRREIEKWQEQRRQRIIKTARALQKDLRLTEDIEWAKRVEQLHTQRSLTCGEFEKYRAAKAIQEDLRSPEDSEWVNRVELGMIVGPFPPAERRLFESSALVQIVGALAKLFEQAFQARAGYTTDPDTGETDGPFIRFV